MTIRNIKAVRCGKGEVKNEGLKVKGEYSLEEEVLYAIPDIGQAWHRKDARVYYSIDKTQLYPNGGTPDTLVVNMERYRTAAEVWNDAINEYFLRDKSTESGAGIIIKVYWDNLDGQGKDSKCGGSVACTHAAPKTNPPESNYPTLANGQPFWIENKPHWGFENSSREWTNEWRRAANPRSGNTYEYLLEVLSHEFGHTIGLQHSALTNTVMSGYYSDDEREIADTCQAAPTDKCGLAGDDENAALALYK